MPRSARIQVGGDQGHYHVMATALNKARLFVPDELKEWMYEEITWFGHIFYVDLYSATVMDNHYQLVLRMRKPALDENDIRKRFETYQSARRHPRNWGWWCIEEWYKRLSDLSCFIQMLNSHIGRTINRFHGTRGKIWGDRFKSLLIPNGTDLLNCMAFVELMCTREGMCASPTEYPYCSAGRFHLEGAKESGMTFTKTSPSMDGFALPPRPEGRQQAFVHFVDHLAAAEHGKMPQFPEILKPVVRHLGWGTKRDPTP